MQIKTNIIFGLLVCIVTLISMSTSSVYSSTCIDEVIDQSTPLGSCGIYNTYVAMAFRPTLKTLTKVDIGLFKLENAYGTVTVSIKEQLYGRDLTSKTIPVDDVPPMYAYDWVEFDFDDISVSPSKSYYIVFTQNNGTRPVGDNSTVHWLLSPWNPYIKGRPWYRGTILSMLWIPVLVRPLTMNPDLSFRTYGYQLSSF